MLFSWLRESFSEASENLGQTIMKETCPSENLSLKIRRTNSSDNIIKVGVLVIVEITTNNNG